MYIAGAILVLEGGAATAESLAASGLMPVSTSAGEVHQRAREYKDKENRKEDQRNVKRI
jgi:hypothetical protein